jgi:peptidyl-prolyl cis-trans isomerase A (cyclophilin A)
MRRRTVVSLALAAGIVALACAGRSPLLQPTPNELALAGPDSFRVDVETSHGAFSLMVHRDWSPYGADRVYFLVGNHFFDEARFYRVLKGSLVQFGFSGNPAFDAVWKTKPIPDDHVLRSNTRGTLSFASAGRDSRTAQLVINLANHPERDAIGGYGDAPVAEVIIGMQVVDSLYAGYGDQPPVGKGPPLDSIAARGNEYLRRAFPQLDWIRTARVTRVWGGGPTEQLRRAPPGGRGRGGVR